MLMYKRKCDCCLVCRIRDDRRRATVMRPTQYDRSAKSQCFWNVDTREAHKEGCGQHIHLCHSEGLYVWQFRPRQIIAPETRAPTGTHCRATSHRTHFFRCQDMNASKSGQKGSVSRRKTSWEIEISAIRSTRSLVRIFILQRVALPLSLPALFLLIYDKLDLVFLSLLPSLLPALTLSP